ncbi:unnamed protein product, partial [Adineta steineri]
MVDINKRVFWHFTFKDLLTILCSAAIPIALAVYTTIGSEQQKQQDEKKQQFDVKQSRQSRQQTLYDEFLNNIYKLHKDGFLNETEKPWAFANAYYRAAHRQWDAIRKADVLQFLKEKQLIGRNNCTSGSNTPNLDDIIRLNELNFDDVRLASQTGVLNQLDLQCVSFNQVSMSNAEFSSVNLNGASFNGGRLDNVKLDGSSLLGASFTGVNLTGADFGSSDLTGVSFSNSDMSGAKLTEDQKKQVSFHNVTMPDGKKNENTSSTTSTTTPELTTTSTTTPKPTTTSTTTTPEPTATSTKTPKPTTTSTTTPELTTTSTTTPEPTTTTTTPKPTTTSTTTTPEPTATSTTTPKPTTTSTTTPKQTTTSTTTPKLTTTTTSEKTLTTSTMETTASKKEFFTTNQIITTEAITTQPTTSADTGAYILNMTLCIAIRYDCDNRNRSCGCGFKNVEINEENNNPEEAIPYSWSMIVSIRYDCKQNGDPSTHCCSGTILNNRYILTAAGCFNSTDNSSFVSDNITIAAGIHSLSQSCQTIRAVNDIFIHPNWTSTDEAMNNIAILRLDEPLDFKTDFILSSICFSSQMDTSVEIMPNSTLAIAGWNVFDNLDNNIDQVLKQLTVYPSHDYNDSFCPRSVNESEFLFCA